MLRTIAIMPMAFGKKTFQNVNLSLLDTATFYLNPFCRMQSNIYLLIRTFVITDFFPIIITREPQFTY